MLTDNLYISDGFGFFALPQFWDSRRATPTYTEKKTCSQHYAHLLLIHSRLFAKISPLLLHCCCRKTKNPTFTTHKYFLLLPLLIKTKLTEENIFLKNLATHIISFFLSFFVFFRLSSQESAFLRVGLTRLKDMALKAAPILVCGANDKKTTPFSQLGISDFACARPAFLKLRVQREWECSSHKAITPVEDEIPSTPDAVEEATQITLAGGLHKDLNHLPKPLSAISFSSRDAKKVRVAYQGVPGAYSEAAALKAYPECETVPCDQFEAAFKAVELWLVDKAVLPIENSVGGSIHRNYDLLLRHRLHIVGEVRLIVNHCLLGLPGVRKEELKRVLSHPQALDQCELTLNALGVTRVNAEDTAGSAQIVASERVRETGAVASARAAEIYGLDVLAEGIQDDSDNVTRFLILAREPIIPGTDRPHKTSIVFSLEEGPGVLFKALAVFALRGINLTKIESRPQKRRPLRVVDDSNRGSATYFDYLFYIDFEASMAEPRAQYALGNLQEFARFLRVLGCYPMDTVL